MNIKNLFELPFLRDRADKQTIKDRMIPFLSSELFFLEAPSEVHVSVNFDEPEKLDLDKFPVGTHEAFKGQLPFVELPAGIWQILFKPGQNKIVAYFRGDNSQHLEIYRDAARAKTKSIKTELVDKKHEITPYVKDFHDAIKKAIKDK